MKLLEPWELVQNSNGIKNKVVEIELLSIPLWWECTVTTVGETYWLLVCYIMWSLNKFILVKTTEIIRDMTPSLFINIPIFWMRLLPHVHSLDITGLSSSWTCYEHAVKKPCLVKPEQIIGFSASYRYWSEYRERAVYLTTYTVVRGDVFRIMYISKVILTVACLVLPRAQFRLYYAL